MFEHLTRRARRGQWPTYTSTELNAIGEAHTRAYKRLGELRELPIDRLEQLFAQLAEE